MFIVSTAPARSSDEGASCALAVLATFQQLPALSLALCRWCSRCRMEFLGSDVNLGLFPPELRPKVNCFPFTCHQNLLGSHHQHTEINQQLRRASLSMQTVTNRTSWERKSHQTEQSKSVRPLMTVSGRPCPTALPCASAPGVSGGPEADVWKRRCQHKLR